MALHARQKTLPAPLRVKPKGGKVRNCTMASVCARILWLVVQKKYRSSCPRTLPLLQGCALAGFLAAASSSGAPSHVVYGDLTVAYCPFVCGYSCGCSAVFPASHSMLTISNRGTC
jgi:hypothetical protein